jgi:hypothetical protein
MLALEANVADLKWFRILNDAQLTSLPFGRDILRWRASVHCLLNYHMSSCSEYDTSSRGAHRHTKDATNDLHIFATPREQPSATPLASSWTVRGA